MTAIEDVLADATQRLSAIEFGDAFEPRAAEATVECGVFGIFNHPPTGTTSATVTTPAHQAVSEHVAEEGTVLQAPANH